MERVAQIHPTADVSDEAEIGAGTKVWHHAQIREHVRIGSECIIGKNVYIDADVVIGNRVKIQNDANIYRHAVLSNGVFVGPGVCLANDRYPRAVTLDGALMSDSGWSAATTYVNEGASLGARSVILPGLRIGKWSLVGAGSVVTKDVPEYGLVLGNPARLVGVACTCGETRKGLYEDALQLKCPRCGMTAELEQDEEEQ